MPVYMNSGKIVADGRDGTGRVGKSKVLQEVLADLKMQDRHSEDGHCPLLSCPSWVTRVTAKKAKFKLSAFLFLVLLIHCFSIPLCLLKACKGLFEVAFSGAAAIQMKPLGAGAHFPEEKRSKNFI